MSRLIKVASVLLVIAVLTLCAGAAYNALSIWHYRQLSGIPGKIYDVDGRKMHLYCTGPESAKGAPTIVLDAGLGDDFTIWARVQPALSRVTRVCSYDRAGFGWSELRSGTQDADAIASQLHQLLAQAGITKPFVLMGHSIAGLYLRDYAAHYPQDLAGLVFVDGATPLQDDRVPKDLVQIQDEQRRDMPWQKLRMALGWYRLHGDCTAIPEGFEAYRAWILADSCIPSQVDASENELDVEHASGIETLHAKPPADLPILIFSRDPQLLEPGWPDSVSRANAAVWSQMQEEEKKLSSDNLRIIAKGSHHPIQVERPDVIIREVTAFVSQLREHRSFANNHATIEE